MQSAALSRSVLNCFSWHSSGLTFEFQYSSSLWAWWHRKSTFDNVIWISAFIMSRFQFKTIVVCAPHTYTHIHIHTHRTRYKVIHHSEHQMTSPTTPILQLLPSHPAHILHSNELDLCQQAPSSSSSLFPGVLPLTLLCCEEEKTGNAESSLAATIYTADKGQAWLGCACGRRTSVCLQDL